MLLDYVLSTLLHMKPISGMEKIDGEEVSHFVMIFW